MNENVINFAFIYFFSLALFVARLVEEVKENWFANKTANKLFVIKVKRRFERDVPAIS